MTCEPRRTEAAPGYVLGGGLPNRLDVGFRLPVHLPREVDILAHRASSAGLPTIVARGDLVLAGLLAPLLALSACEPGPGTLEETLQSVDTVELKLVEDERGRPEAVDAVISAELLDQLRRIAPNSEQWKLVFDVAHAGGDAGAAAAAGLAGDYVVVEDAVRFLPRAPLLRGKPYRARWMRGDEAIATLEFSPNRAGHEATTRAVAIYPTSDVLPVNLRRLYVEFSGPMRRGGAHRGLRLLRDPGGEPVELPFPAPEEELWNETSTRFTLLLPTGRREEGANGGADGEAHGGTTGGSNGRPIAAASPLQVGKRYRLVVERTWRDAEGAPIRAGLDKLFLVDEPDRNGASPDAWTITPPISRQAPLLVEMPSPLDYALLLESIEVRKRDGGTLPGRVRISDNERRWSFQPDTGWVSGPYVLRVDTGLEDPSGNRSGGGASTQNGDAPKTILPFEVELKPVPSTSRR
jgi:hypothetical protein